MPRIYFDTNIYSYLKNKSEPLYQLLHEVLLIHRHNLTFFFSHAHIRDKLKDQSEHRFADFKLIESYTGDNYLSYHFVKGYTSHYLATPLMVYNDESQKDYDLITLFKDVRGSSLATLFENYCQIPLPLNLSIPDNISDEQRKLLSKILPLNKKETTIADLINHQLDFYEEMISDHELYKDVRRIIDQGINNGKFTLQEGQVDFNEALKDSVLRKTFIDFVLEQTTKKSDGKIPYYDYYQQAYHCLDLLGIKKEKLSKKNGYTNMMTDGLHSYYARYCDYLVSADRNILTKSKALYDLLGIHTNVLSVEDFISELPAISAAVDSSIFIFFEKFSKDIREGSRTEKQVEQDRESVIIEISHCYFNFFDVLMEVKESNLTYYFLRKNRWHYLSEPNFREKGMIIDQAVRIFGLDLYGKGKFDFGKEVEEINAGLWQGRTWRVGALIIFLQIHEGLNEFCLLISPAEVYESGLVNETEKE